MSYYKEQLTEWLKTIEVNASKVLDVGGSADPVDKRVKKWNVGEHHILDNNAEVNFHKKWAHPHFPYDIQEEQSQLVKDKYGHTYDCVFCLEVFEYIINPVAAINNIYNLMERGGIAYFTFPFIYPLHQPTQFDSLRYTKSAVKRLLNRFSEVNIMNRVDKSGLLQAFYSADGMRCAKGEEHNVTGFLVRAVK